MLLNNQLAGCSVDSFRLPDTLWAQTVPLRPDAPTRVAVPDSLLPPCTGEWAAHAFFTNSNGELHHRKLTARYRHQRLGLHLQIEGDALLALDSLQLPLLHRLQLIRLRQSNGLPYSLDSLHHYAQRSLLGGLFWGEERHHLRYNINQPTLEAYRILRQEGDEEALRRIRQYLLRTRDGRYGLGWRNTYETASVLSALLPDVLNAAPAPTGPASLAINGRAIELESGRSHTAYYSAGEPIVLSKIGGGPLFLSVTQQYRNPQPVPKSDVSRISTHLEQGGQRVEQLRPGERAALIATVSVSAEAEYVLLELPIPAGCSYAEGQGRQPYEVHRELWRQHAAVFCERLPAGEHRFRVELEPRFPGRYTLNPARAEQMYFPVFYGHGEVKEVVVD